MYQNKQIRSESQRRKAKQAGDVSAYTRKEAQAMIAGTDDAELIARFEAHPNGHIKRYAEHKLAKLVVNEAAAA